MEGFGIENIEKFHRGTGCLKCLNTGYYDRMAVYEYLSISRNIKKTLAKTTDEQDLLIAARKDGLKFLYEDALNKVKEGLTTIEEVIAKVPFDYALKEI